MYLNAKALARERTAQRSWEGEAIARENIEKRKRINEARVARLKAANEKAKEAEVEEKARVAQELRKKDILANQVRFPSIKVDFCQ